VKRTATLGEVAEFINGLAFKPEDWMEEGRRIIRIQNLTDQTKPYNRSTREVDKKFIAAPGDILVSWSASLGVFEWEGPDEALVNQHIFKVVPDSKKIDKNYLRHGLEGALIEMQRHLHGATMQHVNRAEFLATKLFLPPLDEQRRIAAILDQAVDLRRKRQEALSRLDELPGRLLVEACGEPASNPMSWPITRLGDVCGSLSDGPHVSPEYVETGVPFLSTRNIRSDGIVWRDLKFISEADAQIQWKKVKPTRGDVLYTKGGTTGIARAVDFDLDFAVWVHVAVLKLLKNKVDPVWLQEMLNSSHCYHQSQRLTKGIVNRDLGLRRMVDITFPLPPLSLQRAVATRVVEIDKLKAHHRAHLGKLDALFASLQHRAFQGEL
jgi:type I restriction enzyme S subunit